jgi:hypothetical protein
MTRLTLLLALLVSLWCAPAWADEECNIKCYVPPESKTGIMLCGCPPQHNCSLLTVAHNGTVSVVHGLTKAQAERAQQFVLAPYDYCKRCAFQTDGIETAGVDCD